MRILMLSLLLVCSSAAAQDSLQKPQLPQPQPQAPKIQYQPLPQWRYYYQVPIRAPRPITQRFNPMLVAPDGRLWIPRRVGPFGWRVRMFPSQFVLQQ